MRSLIKMQMSRYPVFSHRERDDVSPTVSNNRNHSKNSNNNSSDMNNNLLQGPKKLNKKTRYQNIYKKRVGNSIDSVGYVNLPGGKRIKQKNIYKFVNEITKSLSNDNKKVGIQEKENKLILLKKIMGHLDVQNLQKSDYLRLIQTFGLKIQSMASNDLKTPDHPKTVRTLKTNRKRLNFSEMSSRKIETSEKNLRLQLTSQENRLKRLNFYSIKWSGSKEESKGQRPIRFKQQKSSVDDKINKYRQFLFWINFSNNLYRELNVEKYSQPFKYFIGHGNNKNLVKSLLKKRFWFQQTSNVQEAHFIWTQIKNQNIFKKQKPILKQLTFSQMRSLKRTKQSKMLSLNNVNYNDCNIAIYKILSHKQLGIYKNIKENCKQKMGYWQKLEYLKGISIKLGKRYLKRNPEEEQEQDFVHNHFQNNGLLGNKKAMFYIMREYYKLIGSNIFNTVPLTFHIQSGLTDPAYLDFMKFYNEAKRKKLINYWIIKPGQFSNRGQGITCSSALEHIKKRVSQCKTTNKQTKSIILQLYITNPLLYQFRKFDIRAYFMVTCVNSKFRAYWYQDGYIRTSSYVWTLDTLEDNQIHLTNDAVQKYADAYGRYEPGNKLTYNQLQRYLDSLPNRKNVDFKQVIVPQMKRIATEAVKASYLFLDPHRREGNFEIFGLDFMIDDNFKPWLIEINTNPCLEISCPVLERIIPQMLQNAFRISLDTIFPPPTIHPHTYKYNIPENALHYNKFQIIFDEDEDGPALALLYSQSHIIDEIGDREEDKEQYVEQGVFVDVDIMEM